MKKMTMLLAKAFLRLIWRLKQAQLGLICDMSLFINILEDFMLPSSEFRYSKQPT